MIIGVLIGQFFSTAINGIQIKFGSYSIPITTGILSELEIAGFSIPIAICLFFMMYPTLINIEISELKNVAKHPKPLLITVIANWVITPFIGYWLAHIFLGFNEQYMVGKLLLSASPCTAMVLFWNKFAKGDINQGLINTSLNSIMILFLYSPLASLLIGLSGIQVPFLTLLFGTIFFLAIPLTLGILTKKYIYNRKGKEYYTDKFKPFLDKIAIIALLITLIVLFSLQGENIIRRPFDVLIITVPLVIEYIIIFSMLFFITWFIRFSYEQAVTATIIGSSSHFEIAIATAIALYGVGSQAAFATVIGPLWEVPMMVAFITLAWKVRNHFPRK